MKKIIIAFTFLSLLSCYNQEYNCKDFKTGKFTAEVVINGKKQLSNFERLKDIQIETFNNKKDTSTVRWLSDCEFVAQKLHPKNRYEKKAVAIRIITTKGKTYTFEYNFVGETKKQKGVVTKID